MKPKFKHKLCYGIGNLGYSVVSQTITNFFMFYGTGVLKISGTLVGVAIAISTIWDAVCDPVVGYVSDAKSFKGFGNRCGYILIGTLGVSVCNLLIWFVPLNISKWAKFLWIVVSLVLNETFCSLYATPYGALGGDLTTDYNDRTMVQIIKTIFFILGMILPSVLLQVFTPKNPVNELGQLSPIGYKNLALTSSIIMLVCGLICVFGTKKNSKNLAETFGAVKSENFSFKSLFFNFTNGLKNGQLRLIVFGYSLSMISATILTSVGMHFFTYCFNYSTFKITALLVTLLVGMVLSQPLWYRLSLNSDKKPALLVGLLVAISGVVAIMGTYIFKEVILNISFYAVLVSIFIVGVGAGVLYCLPASMFLDVVNYLNQTKNDSSATNQSLLTFLSNMFNAFALFVVGVLLDVVGFNPDVVNQTRPVQTGIAIILFLGVLISLVGSFVLFYNYKLKEKHFNKTNKNN